MRGQPLRFRLPTQPIPWPRQPKAHVRHIGKVLVSSNCRGLPVIPKCTGLLPLLDSLGSFFHETLFVFLKDQVWQNCNKLWAQSLQATEVTSRGSNPFSGLDIMLSTKASSPSFTAPRHHVGPCRKFAEYRKFTASVSIGLAQEEEAVPGAGGRISPAKKGLLVFHSGRCVCVCVS